VNSECTEGLMLLLAV